MHAKKGLKRLQYKTLQKCTWMHQGKKWSKPSWVSEKQLVFILVFELHNFTLFVYKTTNTLREKTNKQKTKERRYVSNNISAIGLKKKKKKKKNNRALWCFWFGRFVYFLEKNVVKREIHAQLQRKHELLMHENKNNK